MLRQRHDRPHGPLLKVTAAVRANAVKHLSDTLPAKGTLERTNHCIGRFREQVAIAVFAIWPQFEHQRNRSGVASRQGVAENAKHSGFDTGLIFRGLVIGEHDLIRAV